LAAGVQGEIMVKKTVLVPLLLLMLAFAGHADNVTFCYHKFSYSMEDIYSTLPEVFEWQINYIKLMKIPFITQDDLAASYEAGRDPGENILLTVDDGWKSVMNILPILDAQQVPVTLYLYPVVIHKDVKQYINPDDLKVILQNKWINYGCHSYTHPVLTKMDDAQLKHEVVDSKEKLEDWLGVTLNTFAYPYGMLNKRVENYCKKYYSIILGVNDGFNNVKTNRYNLDRFIIYRNTTFGEFTDMCGWIKGKDRDRPFSITKIGSSDDYGKKILFPKIKYYKFKPTKGFGNGNVLLLPGSGIGAGWNYKSVRELLANGTQCGIITNRNNNIPFYRPEKNTMKVIQDWGMKAYMDDMVRALDFITLKEKKSVILTWGDGFDLLMAVLSSTDKYNKKIKGIIVINPTFPEVDGTKDIYQKNLDEYNVQLANGEYAAEGLAYFLKIKTLSDMVVLKPDGVSRFTKKMGFDGTMTNKELLARVLNDADHPDLGINYRSKEYTLDDFRQAFMQPVPLFSMVQPIAYLRDLNSLWLNDFVSEELGVLEAKSLNFPVSYIYSDSYSDAVKKARATFTCLQPVSELPLDGISTIEMMLSDNVAGFVTTTAQAMMKRK
jgi:peptidoglycan/xylan/chitin deacetylase (PgdA/CDA1 family)